MKHPAFFPVASLAFLLSSSSVLVKGQDTKAGLRRANVDDDHRRQLKKGGGRRCKDPAQAVLDLLTCVGNNDAECAAAAYDPSFQRFHNEIFTGDIAVSDPEFWTGAFTFFPTFEFDIKSAYTVEPNVASVRYIEKVTSTDGTNLGLPSSPLSAYPFDQVVTQHEHAIVTVDRDCKLLKWSQYGDNQEQKDVDDISAALLCIFVPTTPGCQSEP